MIVCWGKTIQEENEFFFLKKIRYFVVLKKDISVIVKKIGKKLAGNGGWPPKNTYLKDDWKT